MDGKDSIWDLQQSIKHEREATAAIETSIQKWNDIINDVSSDVTNLTTSGYEWKVRYEVQHLYNRMIMKQMQRMRTEIRMLRFGQEFSPLEQNTNTSVGEWKKKIKALNVEQLSLISLRQMYDNQLDLESMAYFRARDNLDQLTKDTKNTRGERIRMQEQLDYDVIASLHLTSSPRKLKPIAKVIPMALAWGNKNKGYSNTLRSRTTEPDGTN